MPRSSDMGERNRRRRKKILLKKYGYKCVYCFCDVNEKTATLDHILPASKGGSDTVYNLVIACFECNHNKDNKIDYDYLPESVRKYLVE